MVWNLLEEALRAQIGIARRALPADTADFFDGAIGTSARDIWVLDSDGAVVNYLFEHMTNYLGLTFIILQLKAATHP